METRSSCGKAAPQLRAYHAGCTIGPGLFCQGGFGLGADGHTKVTLDDFGLFDIGLCVWIRIEVLDENGEKFLMMRREHTMTACHNQPTGY
jgi:hypothetical protein